VQVSFGDERGGNYKTKVNQRIVKSTYQTIDQNYLAMLGIRLKEGKNLSARQEVIVNEAFVKAAALVNPIGTLVKTEDFFIKSPARIVGVVKDFHFGSLRNRITPLVMTANDVYYGGIWLKIDKNRQQEGIKAFEKIYRKALPNAVFEYNFMDELNNREYLQEQRWQKIVGFATLLSMLLCGMGLFGLTHLAIQQRTKEIGIRKVLGASVTGIVALFSKAFLKLVLLSVVVASPIAYYLMDQWLRNFAYRIPISWGAFGYTTLIIMLTSFLTISYQAIKAALMSPVNSLKSE
jgi:putative ABC transport system permease protein